MFGVNKFAAIQVGLASPDKIREWSYGEVKKPETINYRSLKPERDGLFCEKIFGPTKDYECCCGKYKKIRFSGMTCEKCGVEITTKSVRRERMGHIELAAPVAHIWYLKGIPSRMALILDVSPKDLEEVVYFVSHIVLDPGTSNMINYREVLDEKTARIKFSEILTQILSELDVESPEYTRAQEIKLRIDNYNETFDFFTYSAFISKYTGAKFGIGAEAIQQLLSEVNLDEEFQKVQRDLKNAQGQKQKRVKLLKRLEVIEAFRQSSNLPEWMVLDVLPVIPPDLRPMLQLDGGRFATSDLNDLYRRVITRNIRLKKFLAINTPSAILINEKRMLQESVDALIDNGRRSKPVNGANNRVLKSLSHNLKGKQGRFRQNLLGKRVDYSGRSVIAVGPTLKMYQCGIPREMAIQLFKPFIAAEMMNRGIASGHKQADKMIERYDEKVWDVVENVIKEHPVLLNRAPTLHRLGIQAFEPKLVQGRAIRLHPLVCTAFNADFDGDQMAMHVPLSNEACCEARLLMLGSNAILGPKDGKPIVTPSQDMVLGNYYLTLESTKEDFLKKAEALRKNGQEETAREYELYAESEGKVFRNPTEIELAYNTRQIHLHNRIAIKASSLNKNCFTEEQNAGYLITTVGKIIFNKIFDADFPYLNVVDEKNLVATEDKFFVPLGTDVKSYIANMPINKPFKKKDLSKIINQAFINYKAIKTSVMLDDMKDQGFKYATKSGITVSIADISIVEGKQQIFADADKKVAKINKMYEKGLLTNSERHNLVVKEWSSVKDSIEKKLIVQLESDNRNPLFMMSDSGARGSTSNFTQLSGMRGLMNNPSGDVIEIPIKACFREGLTVSDFFTATHGTRKGGADTALKTADSGYLTRRLVDVAQDVIIREEDCQTDHGSVVRKIAEIDATGNEKVIEALEDRITGRYAMRDVVNPKTGVVIVEGNELITKAKASEIVNAGIEEVEIRSLLACQCKDGVCKKCYGQNLATGSEVEIGESVGIMAAQSIGEPGTQLTMRTFHSGGVAGNEDITQGLPRVQELFEARNPKGQAIISEIIGTVYAINKDEESGKQEVIIENEQESKSYAIPFGAHIRVKEGDKVYNGDKITDGAISPKELLEVTDIDAVSQYILKEIQKVYGIQGIGISDKHIEVIVKQMMRKIRIKDSGDTGILPGTKIDIVEFTRINQEVLVKGKRPAVGRPLVLGITKASLETESFLSAASFQETTRVLTDAAIIGKIDNLHGLKENLIIGKLIPAGTGLHRYNGVQITVNEPEVEPEDFDEVEDFEEELNEAY